jgi:hypothetical protein
MSLHHQRTTDNHNTGQSECANSEMYEQVSSKTDVTKVGIELCSISKVKTIYSLSNTANIWGWKFRSK